MKEFGSLLLGAFIGLTTVIYFIRFPESWSISSVLLIAIMHRHQPSVEHFAA